MTDHMGEGPPLKHRWPAFAVVLAAAFMDLVDGTIVSVAMPRVQDDLKAGYAATQWILAGYLLTFSLALIPGGRLGDIYGRKRIFLIGIAGFTVASAACGAAPNAEVLIAARLVQGLMAALMVPQVLSVAMIAFRPDERPKAFAVYGTALSLANVSGPLLGALFTEYDLLGLQWRAIFYVNVPVGVLAFLGAVWLMPESRAADRIRLDIPGIALVCVVSFTVMYPLIQGRELDWPIWIFLLPAASVPLMLLFGAAERRRARGAGSALIPPALLTHRPFVIGLIVLLSVFSGLASFFLVLNYSLQLGLGWSPLRTALAGIGYPVGIIVTTGIAQRHGAVHGRRLAGAGLAVMTIGVCLLIALMKVIGSGITVWEVAAPIAVMGLGMGLCVSILTGVVLAGVPQRDAGAGSGVANATLQLGAALGIAVVGTIQFALTGSGPDAPSRMYDAASTTLWWNAGAFLLGALLIPLLPRPTRDARERSADSDRPHTASPMS